MTWLAFIPLTHGLQQQITERCGHFSHPSKASEIFLVFSSAAGEIGTQLPFSKVNFKLILPF
jgi:hypothetical protein